MNNPPLATEHYTDLQKSGLSDDTIREAGIKSVPPNQINKRLGFNISGLVSMYQIPFDDGYNRYRVFYESGKELDKDGKAKPKYLTKKGSGNRLYIPSKAKSVLNDLFIPLEITEGEKKALKACQEGLPCIAITGLWNWNVKDKDELISDFDNIALDGRTVYLVPDNDWQLPNRKGERKNLKQAVYGLAYLLIDRGAKVYWRELPQGELKGIDDYLCDHSVDEFKQLRLHQIRNLTLDEMIEGATKDITQYDLDRIIKKLADIIKDTERSLYINKLNEKTGISKTAIKNEIKKIQKWASIRDMPCGKEEEDNSNIIIAHPSYEANEDFISVGYRERIVVNDEGGNPELKDQNFYIMSTHDKILLHEKTSIFEYLDNKIAFDVGPRTLLPVDEKWNKKMIKDFIEKPTTHSGCFNEIKQILKDHVEFQEDCVYGLLAAWIIATYFNQVFDAFPFLLILGKKGCGKSRLLVILEKLSFNAIRTKGITVAALSDTTDGIRGAFLIDQAESLSDPDNAEMVGILADSYSRGGGKRRVVEISSRGRRVLEFETYSPKVFATYRSIHYDLKDRCVEIVMLKGENDFPYPKANSPIWLKMRDNLYRLLLTKWKDVAGIYPQTGKKVKNRVKELWQPIETILRLEEVPEDEFVAIQNFFNESMQETQTELSEFELDLFEALKVLVSESGKTILTTTDIANEINKKYSELDEKGKKSLQTKIGNKIKQLKLYTRNVGRVNRKRAYEFERNHVESVFKRYNTTSEVNTENEPPLPPVTTSENEVVHEVVECKPLSHKGGDHLTTSTTYNEYKKKNKTESDDSASKRNMDTHKTGGQGGQVVNGLSYQELTDDHLKNGGGNEVVKEENNTTGTTSVTDLMEIEI